MNSAGLIATHQFQYDGSHRNRNECTLCAMAMLLTQAARRSGIAHFWLPAAILGNWLDRIPFRYPRFPAWFPGPGGATHPLAALWGLHSYVRKLRREGINFPWEPNLQNGRTPADLHAALDAGYPTLVYGVGETGIPHVVVPIEHRQQDWLVLDPGVPTPKNPVSWTEGRLENWWRNFSIFYSRGTMLSLIPTVDPDEAKQLQ